MMKNSRPTLHIKNGCHYGEALEYFVDFDTYEEALKHGISMPITDQVYKVLFEGKKPSIAMSELMSRELKAE